MADTVPLIDLDAAPPAETGVPARSRLGVPRSVSALGVLLAVLLSLGAGAPPAPAMRAVLTAGDNPVAAFALGPDALYTADLGPELVSGSAVRRYALPGGKPLWVTFLPHNVDDLTVDGDILLAHSFNALRISFLDATAGTVLWSLDEPAATMIALTEERVLLRLDGADGSVELRLAAVRTGATIWSRALGSLGEPLDLDGEHPERIVVLGADGHVTTLRFADGAVLGEGDLGVRVPMETDRTSQRTFVGVTVLGDQVYLSRRDRGRASLTVYGLPGLDQLWRAEGGPTGFVNDCGPVLCISDTRWVSGLDRGDGSVRWSDPAWSNAAPLGDGTLLAYDQQELIQSAILDASTGEVRRKLGATVLNGGLGLRTDTRSTGRTLVSLVDPEGGAVRVVGALWAAVPHSCAVRLPYLACATRTGATTVWRVPAS